MPLFFLTWCRLKPTNLLFDDGDFPLDNCFQHWFRLFIERKRGFVENHLKGELVLVQLRVDEVFVGQNKAFRENKHEALLLTIIITHDLDSGNGLGLSRLFAVHIECTLRFVVCSPVVELGVTDGRDFNHNHVALGWIQSRLEFLIVLIDKVSRVAHDLNEKAVAKDTSHVDVLELVDGKFPISFGAARDF
jgi:hypothetical protein